ncbi:uncharacterized protein N7515_003898 [Penicillium bovifimosum]|uniref:Uncharacterized protein n=1 Tax=Penicillium bovifimosum TaxID=126998 RepID=A0A9W9L6N2_9EURO|nr:uncharacterized protein N7515_003898 [Penicillium bovifimosum]KAJ5139050.1 hypothetical protein N7515_003898 [Penicillium bovifimosum]
MPDNEFPGLVTDFPAVTEHGGVGASSSRPYGDAEDILKHLKSLFANPNRKAEAYSAYHQLTMKPRDSFSDFLAGFLQLAEGACVVRENLRGLYLWYQAYERKVSRTRDENSRKSDRKSDWRKFDRKANGSRPNRDADEKRHRGDDKLVKSTDESRVTFDDITEQCQSISHEISLQQNSRTGFFGQNTKTPRGGASTAHAGSSMANFAR